MTCFYPLHGMRAKTVNKTGKRSITFDPKKGFSDMPVTVPCGRCVGCKLDLSRQWAIRCLHETEESEDNCYITLTYAPEHLPKGANLSLKDFQKFMKRLRKQYDHKIRFYHSGEYGEATEKNNWVARPHYHALLFNLDFQDLEHFKTINGIPLYTSEKLSKIWGKGHASVGRVTMDSAAYVARYIMKKQYPNRNDQGEACRKHYESINTDTGEVTTLKPEYSTMSKNIGAEWFKKYQGDVFPKDFLTYKGEKFKPPKFYDRLYEASHPEGMAKIKIKRIANMNKQKENQSLHRLRTRERVKLLQISRLTRTLGEQNDT